MIRSHTDNVRSVLRYVLGAGFVIAGILHFVYAPLYARVVPPSFAHPELLVIVSGLCEIAGGIGVLIPRVRTAAGVGLILLLIAIFPANVYMALRPELFRDIASPAMLVARLPLQALFIAWVWWCCL